MKLIYLVLAKCVIEDIPEDSELIEGGLVMKFTFMGGKDFTFTIGKAVMLNGKKCKMPESTTKELNSLWKKYAQ